MVALTAGAGARESDDPPYSPEKALTTFRLEPGFRIELVASEPDIVSPVAMEIDENGRMFVVEMPGYPLDVSPTGRIKQLEDTDGDGRVDRATVFADRLVLPNGVMRWKKGLLVTSAPDLLYLEDRDGDGRAEHRETVLTGFAFTNPQHTVNHPVYGLDNWVHLAHEGGSGATIYQDLFGDRGKPLAFPARPDLPGVDPGNRSVRVNLSTYQIEVRSGRTQFGNAFDEWGRYFTSTNNDHIRHEVIAARYLQRNPLLAVASAQHQVSDHGGAARVFPITVNPIFELLTESGEFTSACALTFYTGGAFPGEYGRSTFVAEPVHNLVHRDVIHPAGSTFRASRGHEDREFLASTDAWFRPVNFYVGPDGALYVIDYYRAHIEHPEWTASEYHEDPSAFRLGADRGRIYRITAEGAPPARRPSLGEAPAADLIAALSHPNSWWRRTAQRLLVDRADTAVVPALEELARSGEAPLGRLHALWTLEGLGRLANGVIIQALSDPHPGVRENALQLAEPALRAASPEVTSAVLQRARAERDHRTRFQLLATLGFIDTPEARALQTDLLLAHLDDPWMQVAALSAGPDRAMTYLSRALDPAGGLGGHTGDGARAFVRQAAAVVARGPAEDVRQLIARAASEKGDASIWWQTALLEGLGNGLRRASGERLAESRQDLLTLATRPEPELRAAAIPLLALAGLGDTATASVRSALEEAVRLAEDRAGDPARRADAITLLGLADVSAHRARFLGLVAPQEPEPVQVAAIRALARLEGEEIGREVLARWPGLTPVARSAAIDLMHEDIARQWLLVAAIRDGRVPTWTMNFWQKRELIMHDDAKLRAEARALLEPSAAERADVVNRYAAAVEQGGDAARGAAVFARVCATCHALGGGGNADLGPDLATVRHRPPLALLVDILSPNQSIAQGYETYLVERRNGKTEAGTLADQTPTTITLRREGQPIVIPRGEVAKLTMLPRSSMPEDLDKVITPAEMADLLAFLTQR